MCREYAWAVRFLDEPHSAPVSDLPSPVWRAERSGALHDRLMQFQDWYQGLVNASTEGAFVNVPLE